ncbi:MAG TPA: LysM peptidoglycan-binding domain-containing protein [Pyrinomonadaceae bacterium]|nr:LysM peptidoglycan-binding domain-containing protein [Pyrinomonadaceae bacterium]
MNTPVNSAGQSLEKAKLIIEEPKVAGNDVIDFCFNPTEYQLQKSNNFSEIAIPGLESPPIQFVRGNSAKLTVELLADTSDTLDDVRDKYVTKVRELMKVKPESHAPPIVRFVWGKSEKNAFRGVIESLNITYTLFSPEGTPLRAKLSLTLKEYRPVPDQLNDPPRNSPDVEKSWVVRRGDKYSSIAASVYRDPEQWRAIAEANEVKDPRVLRPGTVLTLPKIR